MLCLKWAQRVKINQDYKGTNPLQKWVFYQSFSCYPEMPQVCAPARSAGLSAALSEDNKAPSSSRRHMIIPPALKPTTFYIVTADSTQVFSDVSSWWRLGENSLQKLPQTPSNFHRARRKAWQWSVYPLCGGAPCVPIWLHLAACSPSSKWQQ